MNVVECFNKTTYRKSIWPCPLTMFVYCLILLFVLFLRLIWNRVWVLHVHFIEACCLKGFVPETMSSFGNNLSFCVMSCGRMETKLSHVSRIMWASLNVTLLISIPFFEGMTIYQCKKMKQHSRINPKINIFIEGLQRLTS